MGTVLVPQLTQAVRDDDHAAIARAESRALQFAVALALPAMLALMLLSGPLVRILFEHGAFSAADTEATAQVLMLLALGLPAHVAVKALSPAFFARSNTRTPLTATLWGLALAIVAAWPLSRWFGAGGVAGAVALGAWASAAVLIRQAATSFGFAVDRLTRRRLALIGLAALLMAAFLWLKLSFAWPLAAAAPLLIQALALGLMIFGALAIYGGLLLLFGVVSPAGLAQAFRKPRGLRP
jgi:putative peptidoglycan lipid II flippase